MPYASKKQWRKFFAMEASGELPKGTAREWARETKTAYKDLPSKKHKKHATDKQAFVDALLAVCAKNNIDDPIKIAAVANQITAVLTELNAKQAVFDGVISGGASALGHALGMGAEGIKTLATIGTVGLPLAAGAGIGLGAAKLRNASDEEDIESLRREAIARAYKRKAEEMRVRQQAQELQESDPNKYRILG